MIRPRGHAHDEITTRLPARLSGEVEPEVLDGQIVDDEHASPPAVPLRVVHVVRVVVQHEHARAAGRHLPYIPPLGV